jgi:hypothetical protein
MRDVELARVEAAEQVVAMPLRVGVADPLDVGHVVVMHEASRSRA